MPLRLRSGRAGGGGGGGGGMTIRSIAQRGHPSRSALLSCAVRLLTVDRFKTVVSAVSFKRIQPGGRSFSHVSGRSFHPSGTEEKRQFLRSGRSVNE